MGDRTIIPYLNCAYCNAINTEIAYAPTCHIFDFKCIDCRKPNFITTDLRVKKIEDRTLEDVVNAVRDASTMMDEKQIKNCARNYMKQYRRNEKTKK